MHFRNVLRRILKLESSERVGRAASLGHMRRRLADRVTGGRADGRTENNLELVKLFRSIRAVAVLLAAAAKNQSSREQLVSQV